MNSDLGEREPFDQNKWLNVLRAAVEAQKLIPGAIAVGGTAAALYARHRISLDSDHLLMNLVDDFEKVQLALEASASWKTARIQPPVLILGSIGGMEVGFRQSRRTVPIETVKMDTPCGVLCVPTLEEILGMKSYLVYQRRTTRDFLDFAALSSQLSEAEVLRALLRADENYGNLQTVSVSLEIAKALHEAQPYDLRQVDLSHYKGVKSPWDRWKHVESVCRTFGQALGEVLMRGGDA